MPEKEMSPTSLYTSSKRGKSTRSGIRKNTLSVHSRLREESPRESINGILKKIYVLTDVPKRAVFRLKKERRH
ncbi:hypothetical protein TNCV_4785011 [Trichonephila clavipes]|nr:hypothetical protein TNCV_4785011 [Trichonephila clavipes]